MRLIDKKTTFGIIIGTRNIFNAQLASVQRKKLLAVSLAERGGRLEREPESTDGVILGPSQFVIADGLGGELLELSNADLNGLLEILGLHAGGDCERARVGQVAVA